MNDMSVAQRIRQLIVSGELKPGGRVAEAAIAERLGVSRTPVRNVIPALATEGLLEPIGRRGYAVRRFSIEDSFRATELRCVLEGQAARTIAAKGAGPELIAALREVLDEGDRVVAKERIVRDEQEAYAAMNLRFHRLIVDAAADALLAELIHRVYLVPFVSPGVVASTGIPADEIPGILQTGQRQHHAIVDAIEAGQADLAEMLMRGHSAPAKKTLGLETRDGEAREVAL
ncbi:MAG: GntR family transcriptional regulator [Pseudomonadota bacterium]|nr:GntR family transcriptional regulator [Pseudomonadota bacterium]